MTKDQTFKTAYQTLKKHADELSNQSEPNIDNLLDIVNESVAAYEVCKARIDAVEQALNKALSASNEIPAKGDDELPEIPF